MEFTRPNVEEFFRTYAITSFAVNKEETRIALSTNLSGKYNVWGLDLPNTYPYQLTYEDQVPAYIEFDPQGHFLLVGFDKDGDENTQMYALPPNGGTLTPVRLHTGRRHMDPILRANGTHIYYCSDKDNHNFLNGYLYDLETQEERVIYSGITAACYLTAVAKDESSFVVSKAFANTNMPAFVHLDGEEICLTPDASVVHVVYSIRYLGQQLVFTTNYGEDMMYLASFDLVTRQFKKLLAVGGSDMSTCVIDELRRTVYISAMRGVEDVLYSYHLETGASEALDLPVAVVEDIQIGDSGRLYVLGRSDVDPFNLHLRSVDGIWRQLTNNRVMGVDREDLSEAEVVHYPSFDGLDIEALWFPAHAETANGYTVVWPHGGPQASERRMFRPFFQFLCSRGYNVWAPNFRGSDGYGAAFIKMVEGDWGHGPRLDMVESIEWLIREGKASRDKLFVVGGSYGGYMTLLLHGRHADYFQACVDIFGPCNLFTFLESVPDHWKPMMRQWLGDVVEDKERLTADSPITYLDGMTKPMLVVQGANDPRVVKAESDQIVAALRAKGTDVEYIVFDDEGHGFTKKANEMTAYRSIVEFLDKHRV